MKPDAFRRMSPDLARIQPAPLARNEPLQGLTWRQSLCARLMVRGSSDPGILAFVERRVRVPIDKTDRRNRRKRASHKYEIGPPMAPGEPLDVVEAARLVGIRKRFALQLEHDELFKKALGEERKALAAERRR